MAPAHGRGKERTPEHSQLLAWGTETGNPRRGPKKGRKSELRCGNSEFLMATLVGCRIRRSRFQEREAGQKARMERDGSSKGDKPSVTRWEGAKDRALGENQPLSAPRREKFPSWKLEEEQAGRLLAEVEEEGKPGRVSARLG